MSEDRDLAQPDDKTLPPHPRGEMEFSFTYQGPPTPQMIRDYEEVIPGADKMILDNLIEQSRHRMALEKVIIEGDNKRANWGLAAATIIALTFLGASVYLISHGSGVEGTVLGTIDLTALVSVFIYGNTSRRRERTEKIRIANEQ